MERFIVMLKENGVLTEELTDLDVEDASFITSCYAEKQDGKINIVVELSIGDEKERIFEDWQFDAVFDCYEAENIMPFADEFAERAETFYPAWVACLSFDEQLTDMESRVSLLINAHKNEINDVFDLIEDIKSEY